ncbi:MAG: hypothetical protein KGL62_06210 [Bradyrhizobium sp.]|uniref:hypothetical protein n=1 Tax=Bradyrhizobium sp. TaxID=376 RepID=UPI00239F9B15|nr:hypothetical protein [Bradyrhizobium sp.]MDE2601949.1 hypothetical protein [Bradyrhizobium sp.]
MSTSSRQDPFDPDNPFRYAPRPLRDEAKPRSAASNSVKPELPRNSASSPSSFENLLREAVRKSVGIPPDPEAVHEPPEQNNELGRWMERIPVGWWSAAAVGGLALVALFFLIPVSGSHAPDSNVSGAVESLKTAVKQASREDQTSPTQPAMTHEHSEALLHRFLQWQQKLDSADSRLGGGSGGQGENEIAR